MKTITTISLVALLAVGCASSGTKFDMADVEAMQPGITTYDEVVNQLGKPVATSFGEDGSKTATWVWAKAGIAGSATRGVGLLFDKDGKMVRVTTQIEH